MEQAAEERAPAARRRGPLPFSLPFLACLAVLAWQALILANQAAIPRDYQEQASAGFDLRAGLRFFYFYQNFGVFPVAVLGIPENLPAGIDPREVLANVGRSLRNDVIVPNNWGRVGDYGRIWLYKPSTWLGARAENASVKPFSIAFFLLCLVATLAAFQRQRRLAQGLALVVLVGSASFQLYETYVNENHKSLSISVALFVLAVNLPFFERRPARSRWDLWRALASGLFLVTVHQVRSEPALIGLSLLPLYLTAGGFPWRRRLLLCGTFLAAYLSGSLAWAAHFRGMQAEAGAFVKAQGGVPFSGSDIMHHPVWHPLFCGLGDFGSDRGYEWNDQVAYLYAMPRLQGSLPPGAVVFRGYVVDRAHSDAPYPLKPEGMEHYDRVLKEKILSDIRAQPLWFAKIIGRRVARILTDSLPAELDLVWLQLRIPVGLWIVLLLAPLFLWRGMFFEVKATLFMAPLSLTPLLVYSGKGNTFYQIAHLVALGLLLGAAIGKRRIFGRRCPAR